MKISDLNNLNLTTMCDGAAEQFFQRELQIVLDNIANHNYGHREKREIIIKAIFQPTEDRKDAIVFVEASHKLPKARPVRTLISIHEENGEHHIKEYRKNRQLSLFTEDDKLKIGRK